MTRQLVLLPILLWAASLFGEVNTQNYQRSVAPPPPPRCGYVLQAGPDVSLVSGPRGPGAPGRIDEVCSCVGLVPYITSNAQHAIMNQAYSLVFGKLGINARAWVGGHEVPTGPYSPALAFHVGSHPGGFGSVAPPHPTGPRLNYLCAKPKPVVTHGSGSGGYGTVTCTGPSCGTGKQCMNVKSYDDQFALVSPPGLSRDKVMRCACLGRKWSPILLSGGNQIEYDEASRFVFKELGINAQAWVAGWDYVSPSNEHYALHVGSHPGPGSVNQPHVPNVPPSHVMLPYLCKNNAYVPPHVPYVAPHTPQEQPWTGSVPYKRSAEYSYYNEEF